MRSSKTRPPIPPLAMLLAIAAGWCAPGCSLDFDTAFSESGPASDGGGGSGAAAGQAGSTGGAAGAEAGAGGASGEGPDASAGAGGAAGEGGAGGSSSGGSDASAGAGGTGASAGSGGMPVDASTDDGDAGFVCDPVTGSGGVKVYRWRDWANGVCKDCPAAVLHCDDFDPVTSFLDAASRILRIELLPGKSEIVNATISFQYEAAGPDGFIQDVPLMVSQNVLQADLSAKIPHGVEVVYEVELKLLDACGTVRTVTDFGIGMLTGADDDILIHCEQ